MNEILNSIDPSRQSEIREFVNLVLDMSANAIASLPDDLGELICMDDRHSLVTSCQAILMNLECAEMYKEAHHLYRAFIDEGLKAEELKISPAIENYRKFFIEYHGR